MITYMSVTVKYSVTVTVKFSVTVTEKYSAAALETLVQGNGSKLSKHLQRFDHLILFIVNCKNTSSFQFPEGFWIKAETAQASGKLSPSRSANIISSL